MKKIFFLPSDQNILKREAEKMSGRIEKIANEKLPRAFSVKDGHMFAIESDLFLRSKLNKINKVVDEFFHEHHTLNTND